MCARPTIGIELLAHLKCSLGGFQWDITGAIMALTMTFVPAVAHQMKHSSTCSNAHPLNSQRDRSFRMMKLAVRTALIPKKVYNLAEALWQSVCECTDIAEIAVHPLLQQVLNDQLQVGLHNFAVGWFSKTWALAMQQNGSRDPDRHVAQLLTILWGLCSFL
jgi:hypothetical protein